MSRCLSQPFARYEEYGTSLKGLLAEGILDEKGAEMFHGSDFAASKLLVHYDCFSLCFMFPVADTRPRSSEI